jgi:glycosyltransferase involved in cell wall biosynthesis
MRAGDVTPLRILAYPKGGAHGTAGRLSAGLEARGAQVEDFTFLRALVRRFDVVHLHWPETHLRSSSWWRALGKHARLLALVLWLRARRTKVVWTLHNLEPHERDHRLSRFLFARWFPRACTHVIALTPTGLQLARARYPALRDKAAAVVPRGHYRDVYRAPPAAAEARARLGLAGDPFTMLFFGTIRPYKNVPALITAFRALPSADAQLVVAGQPMMGEQPARLVELAGADPRIRLCLRWIPDDEVPAFFGAADLVVLPFADVLNSASVLLALSLDRPVLAPRIGALPDIQRVVGSEWLLLYEGPLTAAHLARARAQVGRRDGPPAVDLSAFEWDAIVQRTLAFFRGEADPAVGTQVGRGGGRSIRPGAARPTPRS